MAHTYSQDSSNDRLIASTTGTSDYEDWVLASASDYICTTCDRVWRMVGALGFGRCVCGNAGYRPKKESKPS